jgi:hypothetical protein
MLRPLASLQNMLAVHIPRDFSRGRPTRKFHLNVLEEEKAMWNRTMFRFTQ